MEPIFKEHNTVQATEILYFENAEIEKVKGNARTFASMGPLSVLYFKDYNRFVLQVNDWKFPLVRRLPIMCADKWNMKERMYHLPAMNGFSYNLRIRNIHSSEALHNFETILREQSGFFIKGEEQAMGKMEGSPDDKLVRHMKKETGMMDKIKGHFHMGVEKTKIAGKSLKDSTKHIGSKKMRMNPGDIKNKNFKKSAHATFSKTFFDDHEKMTKDIHVMRKHNFSNFKQRSFDELKKADHLPILYLPREDVEEAILNNKDLASMGKFHMGDVPRMEERRTGLMGSIKQELNYIKDNLTGRVNKAEQPMDEHKVSLESMTHYQG